MKAVITEDKEDAKVADGRISACMKLARKVSCFHEKILLLDGHEDKHTQTNAFGYTAQEGIREARHHPYHSSR